MNALAQRRMHDPKDFGRVAVLLGGWSAERAVSLQTGQAVLEALQRNDVDATGVDVDRERLLRLATEGYERAFIALHGAGGEDGTVQAALEIQQIAYTGSGIMGSALGLDKEKTKALWTAYGIPTPPHRLLTQATDMDAVADELGLPLFVKPATEGSSIGMTRVDRGEDLPAAFEAARQYCPRVLAERFIDGPEYTATILGPDSLPLIRIEPAATFYDYHAKYEAEDTGYICPCGLEAAEEQRLAKIARQAFDAAGASGWGRVDFMLDAAGQAWFLELNTVPGMTSHSLVPMAAKQAGLDFDELVWRILETSVAEEVQDATA